MKRLLVCVVGLVLLTACGGGDSSPNTNPDPNNPPGGNTTTYKKLGFVGLTELDGTPVFRSSSGIFFEYNEAIAIPTNRQFLPSDTCVVTTTTDEIPLPPETPTDNAKTLDAGEALPLTAPGVTDPYATLERRSTTLQGQTFISYDDDSMDSLPEFPASLILNIPGADNGFPEFKDVAMPTIPTAFEFSVSGNDLNAITKNTTFSWTGQGSTNTVFTFFGSQDLSQTTTVTFYCVAKDDNGFAFPDKTKGELDAAGFTTGRMFSASRESFRTQTSGDAALFLYVSRSKNLFTLPTP